MVSENLTSAFCDESRRIIKTNGAAYIYPNFQIYQREFPICLRNAYEIEAMSDEEIFAEYADTPTLGWGRTETAFLAQREKYIQEVIEEPCQPLARLIMDQGYHTYSSNAYNGGVKGVRWCLPVLTNAEAALPPEQRPRYFTSLLNGRTYPIINSWNQFGDPIDPGFSVESVMPEGYDPSLPLDSLIPAT